MYRVILLSLFLCFSIGLKAEIFCEKILSKDAAVRKVDEFVEKNKIGMPDKFESYYSRSKKSCHYIYSIDPAKDSGFVWQHNGAMKFYLTQTGDVVFLVTSQNQMYQCPEMHLRKEYFIQKLKKLREKNKDLPAEPKQYDVDLAIHNCEYIYVEHLAGKDALWVPTDLTLHTFYFDYFGDLFFY